MAYSLYENQIDPQVIQGTLGKNWLDQTKLFQQASNLFVRQAAPIQGTLSTTIRQAFFQGTAGQVVPIGGAASSVGRTQTAEIHPNIWRDSAFEEDSKITDILEKAASGSISEADVVAGAREAIGQWTEDAFYRLIEGTAGALTSNQVGNGSTVDLAGLIAGKAALADRGLDLDGGSAIMRSELYYKLVSLGVIAATSNTFGNAAQDAIVKAGSIPFTLLGMTPLVTDKIAIASTSAHYVYFVGPGAMLMRGNDVPEIKMADLTALKRFGMVMTLRVKFGLGFRGATWGASASTDTTDADLATSANWTVSDTNSKNVKVARVYTDN